MLDRANIPTKAPGNGCRLSWGDWNPRPPYRAWDRCLELRPPYRAWDRCLELRRAETPFGHYLLLRRHSPYKNDRTVLIGKWFVDRPAARQLGPFDDDVQAARAAQADYVERAAALRAPDPELDRLRAENAQLRAENVRLGLAFHHAINSPQGVLPPGFDDFYEAEKMHD